MGSSEPNLSRLEIMGLLQCGYGFPNLKTKEDESKAKAFATSIFSNIYRVPFGSDFLYIELVNTVEVELG